MFKQILALAGLTLSFSAKAATLVVIGGQLTGATDVEVDGAYYDVQFVEGSCNSLFNNCSDFTFTTIPDALLASQALLDQVLTGVYDDSPELTFGMSDTVSGLIYTPRASNADFVFFSSAINNASGSDSVSGPGRLARMFENSANSERVVWAEWTVSQVPIPAAAWLFGSALLGLGVVKRKKA